MAYISRPDFTTGFEILAQTQDKSTEHIFVLNKSIRKARDFTVNYELSWHNINTLWLDVLTNASIAKIKT